MSARFRTSPVMTGSGLSFAKFDADGNSHAAGTPWCFRMLGSGYPGYCDVNV